MKKITPFLWFDSCAEEAANFYCSVFKNSKINKILHSGEGGALPKGEVLTVNFELDGAEFTALNGGQHYKINPAISFVINCENQKEIDYFWEKLTENGGKEIQCGWLEDKFGVTWQVVPHNIGQLLCEGKNTKKVMDELLKMKKLDINILEKAHNS